MPNFLRKPLAWVVIFIAIVLAVFTFLPGPDDNVERPLREFVEDARTGLVEHVEVDGSTLEYQLRGDEQTYEAQMEDNDTVRQVLQDAGIAPEDFPPIEVKERSFWSRIPGLIFTFLPLGFFLILIYVVVRAASGGGRDKTPNTDPVCAKRVGVGDAAGLTTFQDVTYRFCSEGCKQRFDADPVSFLLKR